MYRAWGYITRIITGSITLSTSLETAAPTQTVRAEQLCGIACSSNEQNWEAHQRTSAVVGCGTDVPSLPSVQSKPGSQIFLSSLHSWHAGKRQLFVNTLEDKCLQTVGDTCNWQSSGLWPLELYTENHLKHSSLLYSVYIETLHRLHLSTLAFLLMKNLVGVN